MCVQYELDFTSGKRARWAVSLSPSWWWVVGHFERHMAKQYPPPWSLTSSQALLNFQGHQLQAWVELGKKPVINLEVIRICATLTSQLDMWFEYFCMSYYNKQHKASIDNKLVTIDCELHLPSCISRCIGSCADKRSSLLSRGRSDEETAVQIQRESWTTQV